MIGLKLEGFLIAHSILRHRCWRCRIPLVHCKKQRQRGKRLEQIKVQLWEAANG